jgi:hypothetical protein
LAAFLPKLRCKNLRRVKAKMVTKPAANVAWELLESKRGTIIPGFCALMLAF